MKKEKKTANIRPPPEISQKVDTKVKCFEDVHHAAYGTLCIEDYSLKSLAASSDKSRIPSSSVLCFANWDNQRCTSCVYNENLCHDNDQRHHGGGYELSCGNLFPQINRMTVCGKQISYSNTISKSATSQGGGSTLLVSIVFLLVALRALAAVYCKSDHHTTAGGTATGSVHHSKYHHLKDDFDEDDNEQEEETTELTTTRGGAGGARQTFVKHDAVVRVV